MGWWKKLFARESPAKGRQPCYIEFEVVSPSALMKLTAMVEAFKAEKGAESDRSHEEWASSFSQEELDTFWCPDEQELQAWERYWFSTPLPKRHSPEMPTPPWHFASMLEAMSMATTI